MKWKENPKSEFVPRTVIEKNLQMETLVLLNMVKTRDLFSLFVLAVGQEVKRLLPNGTHMEKTDTLQYFIQEEKKKLCL